MQVSSLLKTHLKEQQQNKVLNVPLFSKVLSGERENRNERSRNRQHIHIE